MQDRYAGDIGDYVKLGLLRALSPNYKLGLVWYKIPNEEHNNDGRHIKYLHQPEKYSHFDRDLFQHLARVTRTERSITSLLPALEPAVSFEESIDLKFISSVQRRAYRAKWFSRALDSVHDCNIVFADPDNGIVDDSDKRKGSAKFRKQIPLAEALAFAENRCAVIYHHNTRRAGGHDAEVDHLLQQISIPSIAVRAKAYSPRTFFVVNPTPEIRSRVHNFCATWQKLKVYLH